MKTGKCAQEMTELEVTELAELGRDTKLNLAVRNVIAWSSLIDIQRYLKKNRVTIENIYVLSFLVRSFEVLEKINVYSLYI